MADAPGEVEVEGAQAPAPQPVAGSVNSQNQHAKLGKVITRMLQADAEVGAVANATASCISGAVELFVEKLVKEAQATVTGGRTKIDAGHMYVRARPARAAAARSGSARARRGGG